MESIKKNEEENKDKNNLLNEFETNATEQVVKINEKIDVVNSQKQSADDLDIDSLINSNYQFFYLDTNVNLHEPFDNKIEQLSFSDNDSQAIKSNESVRDCSNIKQSDKNNNVESKSINESIENIKKNLLQGLNEKIDLPKNDKIRPLADSLNLNTNSSNALVPNYFIDVNQPMSSKMANNLDKNFALMQKNFLEYQKSKHETSLTNINFQLDSSLNNLNSSILNQKKNSRSISQPTSSNEIHTFKPDDLINLSVTNSTQYSFNYDQNKNLNELNSKYHPYKGVRKQTNSEKNDIRNQINNYSKEKFGSNQYLTLEELDSCYQEENVLVEPVIEKSKDFRSKYVLSPKPIYQKTTYSNIIGQQDFNNFIPSLQMTSLEEKNHYEFFNSPKINLVQTQENLKTKNKSPIKSIENQPKTITETKTNQYISSITHKTRPKRFDVLELIIGKFHLQSFNLVPINSPNKKNKLNEEYAAKMKVVFNKQRFIYEFCIQTTAPNCESDSNNSCSASSNQNQLSSDQNLVTYENHFYVMIIPFSFLEAINIENDNVRLLVNKQPHLFLGNVSQRASGHVSFSNLNDSVNSNFNENESGLYINLNKSLNEVYPSTVFNGVNPNYNFKIPLNYNNERDPTYGECHCNALHILKLAPGQTQRLKACLINYTNFLENNPNTYLMIDFSKLFEKKISKYVENYIYDLEKVQWVDSEEQVQPMRYDLNKNQQVQSINVNPYTLYTGKQSNGDNENFYKRKRSNTSNKDLFSAKRGLYSNEHNLNLLKNNYNLNLNNNYGLFTPIGSANNFPSTSSALDAKIKDSMNENSNMNLLSFNQTVQNYSNQNPSNYYFSNNNFPYTDQSLPFSMFDPSQQKTFQNNPNLSKFSSLNLNYPNYQPPYFAPTILKPIDRKKFESRRPCECTQKCAKGQCSCFQSGRICIYFQQNSCTCSSCENPLNLLSLHEVDINRALEDLCLTFSLPQISYNNLQTTLCKNLYTPCCNNQITLPHVIPNIKMCPIPGCNKTLRYSWCRKTLILNSSNIFHCEHCKNCENFIGGRCKICRIAKLDLFVEF